MGGEGGEISVKEYLETKIGWLEIETSNNILTNIGFLGNTGKDYPINFFQKPSFAYVQLEQYLSGLRNEFDLKIDFRSGTEWQSKVWREITAIPYGVTVTYGEIAENLGDKKMARAVANACGANPMPIVVPCHRVVAKSGLGGYAGGLKLKKWLLKHENIV
jgi:O-6-methylguanine DNA methyltransferase